jgi:hypothetical protein
MKTLTGDNAAKLEWQYLAGFADIYPFKSTRRGLETVLRF